MLLRLLMLISITLMYSYQQVGLAQSTTPGAKNSKKRVYTASTKKDSRFHIERLGLVATVNYFGSGLGINYGYTPNDFFQIDYQLVATTAKLSGATAFEAQETFDVEMLRLSALPKIQLISQFYIGAGFNVSSLSGTYGFQGTAIQGGEVKGDLKAVIWHGDIFLGSQWQSDRFYVAADWLGVSYINKPQTRSIETNPDLDNSAKLLTGESVEDRVDREITQQLRLYYLSVHAGFRF